MPGSANWARGELLRDAEFDRIYPEWVRKVSESHWTPVSVARRAAELLVVDESTRVLDVGSGVGKFCLVGAMVTPATFFGAEQRASLVEIARQAATACELSRVHFVHENMMTIDWSGYDSFYLFNPYSEHIFDYSSPIEDPITTSLDHYNRYVTTTCRRLVAAPVGVRVVTYYGYGGPMPSGYRRILREPAGKNYLELWVKESSGQDDG